jgi:hypothetical protein
MDAQTMSQSCLHHKCIGLWWRYKCRQFVEQILWFFWPSCCYYFGHGHWHWWIRHDNTSDKEHKLTNEIWEWFLLIYLLIKWCLQMQSTRANDEFLGYINHWLRPFYLWAICKLSNGKTNRIAEPRSKHSCSIN